MKQPFREFLADVARSFVFAAREGTREAVQLAARADEDLGVRVPIGGIDMKVEGAANLPAKILMMRRARIRLQEGFLSRGRDGRTEITLKRRLLKKGTPVTIEIEFDRSAPLESMELVRERALDVVKASATLHEIRVGTDEERLLAYLAGSDAAVAEATEATEHEQAAAGATTTAPD